MVYIGAAYDVRDSEGVHARSWPDDTADIYLNLWAIQFLASIQ